MNYFGYLIKLILNCIGHDTPKVLLVIRLFYSIGSVEIDSYLLMM